MKARVAGCPLRYFLRPDVIAEPRPVPTVQQAATFARAAMSGEYVSEADRIDREQTCAACDQLRIDPAGNVPWCNACGCGVSNAERQIRNLAAYVERLPDWGCKHPKRGEPNNPDDPSGPAYGWRRVALPQVPFSGERLRVHTSPNGVRFAFVHVPKAAGCSVCELFGVRPGHNSLASADSVELAGAFTFAVVRDPWERLVSAFHYLIAGGARTRVDLQYRKALLPYIGNFPVFARALAEAPEKFAAIPHLRPQTYWVAGPDGKPVVDVVCRFERLEEDLKAVCGHLGIQYRDVHLNRGIHAGVLELCNNETIALIGKAYAADVQAFGYKAPEHPPSATIAGRTPWAHPRASSRTAILTATDDGFYPGFQAMAASVRRLDREIPIVCVDVGMTEDQRRHALNCGVFVSPRPPTPIDPFLDLAPPQHRGWYPKPWYFDALGPYRRALWLDADTVVLRDLDKLLAMLDDGPVFTRSPGKDAEVSGNLPELYELFPVSAPIFNGGINAGVVGMDLDRDARLMSDWRWMVQRAAADHGPGGVGEMARWGDQGPLLWALHKLGLTGRILDDGLRWNYTPNRIARLEGRPYPEAGALEELEKDYPDAAIVHWAGAVKPWQAPTRDSGGVDV